MFDVVYYQLMKRKEFFKRIFLGGPGILLLGEGNTTVYVKKQKILLATVFISGYPYYDGPEVENQVETGMPLLLNRQPHNRYDKAAVEVFTGEAKLGYLPRPENREIARLMDHGTEVKAKITELTPDAYPFGNVKVEVWYEREFE